jgi:transporter family protein
MSRWFAYTLLAMVLWGLWGFFAKLAARFIPSQQAYIYEVSGTFLVGVAMLFLLRFQPGGDPRGALFGVLTGVTVGIGTYFFFVAIATGRSSVVVTVTALYPVVTLLLGLVFLKEGLAPKHWLGIVLALAAIWLLST